MKNFNSGTLFWILVFIAGCVFWITKQYGNDVGMMAVLGASHIMVFILGCIVTLAVLRVGLGSQVEFLRANREENKAYASSLKAQEARAKAEAKQDQNDSDVQKALLMQLIKTMGQTPQTFQEIQSEAKQIGPSRSID